MFFSFLLTVDFFTLKHGNFFNLIMRSLFMFTTLEKLDRSCINYMVNEFLLVMNLIVFWKTVFKNAY